MNSKKNKDSAEVEIFNWMIGYILSLKVHQIRNLNVDRLAHELNMSRSYLYEVFKTSKIKSPGFFLKFIKIFRASVLLLQKPQLSVKKVSKKIGFNTVDYFIRVFKKYIGMTPLKFKKHCQKERSEGVGSFPEGK